jgi:hypothetical protein
MSGSPYALANYVCTGSLDAVAVGVDGSVYLSSGSSGLIWVQLCQVAGTANGVSAETCKSILATLLTARATSAPVSLYFNDSLSCTSHPQWSALIGWYFGAQL